MALPQCKTGSVGATASTAVWRRGFPAASFVPFAIFTAIPVVAAGVISLLKWNLFSPPSWAGLDNFVRLGGDRTFWQRWATPRTSLL